MRDAVHYRAKKLRTQYDQSLAEHKILSRIIAGQHASFVIGHVDDSHYRTEIAVLSWGTLMVHGDIDTVVFQRCSYKHWRQVLNWLSGENYDYAEEKAVIGVSDPALARVVDPDVAKDHICYYRRHRYMEKETARAAWNHVENGEVMYARDRIYEDTEDAELIIGTCTAPRVFMAQAAITKLCRLLEAEEADGKFSYALGGDL